MAAPDWQSLRVQVNDRAAIYAESFPGQLAAAGATVVEWLDHSQAHDLLYTFAGAWPTLGRDADLPSSRFVYRSDGAQVCRFRGVELAPGVIVVDDVTTL